MRDRVFNEVTKQFFKTLDQKGVSGVRFKWNKLMTPFAPIVSGGVYNIYQKMEDNKFGKSLPPNFKLNSQKEAVEMSIIPLWPEILKTENSLDIPEEREKVFNEIIKFFNNIAAGKYHLHIHSVTSCGLDDLKRLYNKNLELDKSERKVKFHPDVASISGNYVYLMFYKEKVKSSFGKPMS